MKSFIELILSFLLMLAFLVPCTKVLAFFMTNERYDPAATVSDQFRLVIIKDDSPALIRWPDYDPNMHQLYLPEQLERFELGKYEHAIIKPVADRYDVVFRGDNYNFYSSYEVIAGRAMPKSHHLAGPFLVLPVLLLAIFLATLVTKGLLAGFVYLTKRQKQRVH